MSSFTEKFVSAWRVSTPLISARTSDAASTIANVRKAVANHVRKVQSKDEEATNVFISLGRHSWSESFGGR